jgi:hypothetical protein
VLPIADGASEVVVECIPFIYDITFEYMDRETTCKIWIVSVKEAGLRGKMGAIRTVVEEQRSKGQDDKDR